MSGKKVVPDRANNTKQGVAVTKPLQQIRDTQYDCGDANARQGKAGPQNISESGFNLTTYAPLLWANIIPSTDPHCMTMTIQEQVQLVNYVRSWGVPNVLGSQVPLKTNWNLRLAEQLATSRSDREVVKYLTYGWPLNHDGSTTSVSLYNHPTAMAHADKVTKYINKEYSLGCLLGPFVTIPWENNVAISPMSTRPKRQSSARRIIMDLSWPRDGTAVNQGISEVTYMGHRMDLHYPTVDDLCKRVFKVGPGAMGYRRDLGRAFKQLFCCPASWPLMGIFWQGAILFDKSTMMGSRSAPYCCQRSTNFIRHIMNNLQYFVVNYVDDFMGVETAHRIWQSYMALHNLLRDLGVKEAEDKAVPPSTIIEFLGVLYDMVNMTISVTPERLYEFAQELAKWMVGYNFTRKQLESLLGKMQFVTNCVRPARVFVFRLRNHLSQMKDKIGTVTLEMSKDILWWKWFMPKYNGTSIMWMNQKIKDDELIASDSCLKGFGAICGKEFLWGTFPQQFRKYKIHHLEMLAILVAVKTWIQHLSGFRFVMLCDNQSVVDSVNGGYSRDIIIQDLMRELVAIACIGNFEVILRHVASTDNRRPDILSRICLGGRFKELFLQEFQDGWSEKQIATDVFESYQQW